MVIRTDCFILFVSISFFLFGCTKNNQQEKPSSDSFYKVYPSKYKNEVPIALFKRDAGGYILFTYFPDSVNTNLYIKNIITNEKGDTLFIRTHTLQKDIITNGVKDKDGNILFYSSAFSSFLKFNQAGELIFQSQPISSPDSGSIGSKIFYGASGAMYISNSRYATPTQDTSVKYWVHRFNSTGAEDTIYKNTFLSANTQFSTSLIRLCRVANNGDMYFYGSGLKKGITNLYDSAELFMYKNSADGKSYAFKLIPKNKEAQNFRIISYDYTLTKDSGVLFILNLQESGVITHVNLIKVDKNMNVVWNGLYDFHNSATYVKNIITLSNGDYAFCGYTYGTPNSNFQPFVMRVDITGKEVWGFFLSGPISGEARTIIELDNGDIVLAGITNSFGYGKTESGVFIYRMTGKGRLF